MSTNSDITKKINTCLNEVKKLKEKKANTEEVINLISSTLEDVCGEEDCIESAPLKYMLACALIDVVHERSENEDDADNDGLNEDDMEVAWENLESARLLYTNAEDKKDYRKELADISMKQGEIDIEKGDYESSVNDHKEALKLREAVFPAHSREVADALFFVGISFYYNAETNALFSRDDESLEKVAEEQARSAIPYLERAKAVMEWLAVTKAMEEGLIAKKEITEANQTELVKEVKEKSMSKDVEDLMSIADELSVNVEKAKSFSVKKVIEEESKNVASLRDLMEKEQVDDEDDEDFSEEEEEDDDVIIEDVEELKKSVKRVGESLPDNGKEAKKN
ncbi:hypothetical protein WA538_000591 [Blastocystis sp. DL]